MHFKDSTLYNHCSR